MDFLYLDEVLSPDNVGQELSRLEKWFNDKSDWLIGMIPNIIAAIVIFVGGWWLIKLLRKIINRALKRGKADQTVISFLDSVVNTTLLILLGVCVIGTLGFDISTIVTALGAAAVTVGLALKDSLSNVASGTLIILNKKFRTGDFIETEGIIGEVIKIEMMYTTLRTYDYKEVMIPNSRLTSNNVINHFSLDFRRADIPVPISYKEDIEKAREVIMKLIKENELVLQERNNKVSVDKFNDSSVDLIVWIWCKSENYWTVLLSMREKIKNALDENGIEIPFNQLDVHFDPDTELKKSIVTVNAKEEK